MVRRVFKKFFWNAFDHLGACVVLNLLAFIVSLPWVVVAYFLFVFLIPWLGATGLITGIAAGLASLWLSPGSLGLLVAASGWADYRRPDGRRLWAAFRRRFGVGVWLSGVTLALFVVLGVNGAFYLRLAGAYRWIGYFLAGVMLWAQLFLLLVTFHLGLFLARDEGVSVREGAKRAAFLALKLPLQSLAIAGATLGLAVVLAITQVGIPFVAASLPAVLAATGERELLKRFRPPTNGQDEADRAEEVRTFRDLIRPWNIG